MGSSAYPPFLVVIPARYAARRLPGKALALIDGRPMIQHVYERALESGAERVILATDDGRIRTAATGFGAEVWMTSRRPRSGTERIAEVLGRLGVEPDRIVVNVQGDEPLIPPEIVRQAAENLACRPRADIATLCQPIDEIDDLFDPNVVKVVFDEEGIAHYFSRAPIPWCRDRFAGEPRRLPPSPIHFRHIGIYAYRAEFVGRYVTMPPGRLEAAESLEQLRALAAGACIHVAVAAVPPGPGVDTPADLERVRALMAAG